MISIWIRCCASALEVQATAVTDAASKNVLQFLKMCFMFATQKMLKNSRICPIHPETASRAKVMLVTSLPSSCAFSHTSKRLSGLRDICVGEREMARKIEP